MRFCHSISAKEERKDSTAAIGAGGRLGITKFGIFPPMMSHWQHSTERSTGDLLPSRKKSFSNARRNVRTGLRLAGILGLLILQAGEFQLSNHSIPKLGHVTPSFLLLLQASSHSFP